MTTTYTDALDDFFLSLDPAGFTACVTFPPEKWDNVECDGLNPAFESAMRSAVPMQTIIIGSSVHRSETWGFRVFVLRHPSTVVATITRDDAQLVDLVREAEAKVNPAIVAPDAHLVATAITLGDARAVRLAYASKAAGTSLYMIDYVIPGAHATYEVEFLSDDVHQGALEPIADRAMQSLHVVPAPQRGHLVVLGVAAAVFGLAFLGTLALVFQLLSARRKQRSSRVSWPGVRERSERR